MNDDAAKTISINIESVFTLLRHLIPHYKKQGFGQVALCGNFAGYKGLAGSNFEIHFPKKFTLPMKILSLLPYRLYFLLERLIKR